MKSSTHLSALLMGLVAIGGITSTAVATIGACCKNVQYYSDPAGQECSGTQTTICDLYSTGDANGKRSEGLRVAVCTTYYANSFARTACESSPGDGWVKLPLPGPGGYCCWAYQPVPDPTNLTFQVSKCTGSPCGDGQPNPIEP